MSYSQYQGNPYGQGPSAEAGHGYRNGQPQESHEMQPYDQYQQGGHQQSGAPVMTQQEYLSRVSHVRNEIRSLTADVQRIAGLHQRALSGNDGGTAEAELDRLVQATQLKNGSIRDQIRVLKGDCERTTDGSRGLKTRQFKSLSEDFRKELQGYHDEETQYRARYRDQIARQYRIVNPAATEDEVQQVLESDLGSTGVFQQALQTNRTGQARAVLGAVRDRHSELQRIEQSITELAAIFNDLDTLVVLQEATVQRAEDQVQQTNDHLQKGNEQVGTAIVHAKKRRKYFWYCVLVGVIIVILIAVAIALAVYFTKHPPGSQ